MGFRVRGGGRGFRGLGFGITDGVFGVSGLVLPGSGFGVFEVSGVGVRVFEVRCFAVWGFAVLGFVFGVLRFEIRGLEFWVQVRGFQS